MDFEKLVDVAAGQPVQIIRKGRPVTVTEYPPTRKRPVFYESRSHEGQGVVIAGRDGGTGPYVRLHDKQRDAIVMVRPSQVRA